ncbi:MAG: tRNA pseudouridine synthase A [Gammaproteobacteria bacterium]|nr:tRNA pseudouridine synthase A [Gammaproteobacteria bacterium]
MKIAAVLEYCGSRYSGWQYQHHTTSIQQHVESALTRVADHEVRVHCAGRTDAGVHALNQVIHFETDSVRPVHAWVAGSNTYLPADISLLWVQPIADDFHARYSALRRSYRYIILNRPTRPGLNRDLVSWEHWPLDVDLMRVAASDLIGEHDFTSFRAAGCQAKVPIREVQKLEVFRSGEYVVIEITANAFLQHMVRNIAGVLMAIGSGKQAIDWVRQILEARDRTKGGVTAPASGLYLTRVEYPETYGIPKPAPGSWPLLL